MMHNPMLSELMRMRAQGIDPLAARVMLMQRFPQLRQAQPFLQGQTPQEIDSIAQNAARSMGYDPNAMISQIQQMMRR